MNLCGLQPLTMLDFPGKVACTIFISGCNFRCPFCHNSSLLTGLPEQKKQMYPDLYTKQEILRFINERKKVLDGVVISGGEPLLNDIEPMLSKIKEMGLLIKIDHNGSKPDVLLNLINKGLVDYVAMDIKNAPSKYAETIGYEYYDMKDVHETIKLLLSDVVDYEFRTTVVNPLHQESDFEEIRKMIQGAKRYYLQQYIPPGDTDMLAKFSSYSRSEMEHFAQIVQPYVQDVQLRGI